MAGLTEIYRPSLALLTDLYELTMAYGYWRNGVAERESVFHLSFRSNPFEGGFAIACGLHDVIDYISRLRFEREDVDYLATLKGNDGQPLFDSKFLEFISTLKFEIDIDAIPEGTAVFGHEPLVRVRGPILQCQVIETALLTLVNFQTLIATKAARVCLAARGEPVIEFGLRRAQGIDGGLTVSRAAYIGGCAGTSNVLAGRLFGIPVTGTHAHSWVMSFDSELEAFDRYADAMPNNCIFLVDTYNTLNGVRHAVEVGKKLRERGHQLAGIRLDSGDLAYLSIEARKILDAADFTDAKILASNDLDEHLIESLKQQGATISIWGVGTRLATAYDQPALGGVYKLSALRDDANSPWDYKIKLSEQPAKVSFPGVLQVRRFYDDGLVSGDMIYNVELPSTSSTMIDPMDDTRRKSFPSSARHEDLLVPIFRNGKAVYQPPAVGDVRKRTAAQLAILHPTIKRFVNPHRYPVGLEEGLFDLRHDLIVKARSFR